MVIVDDEAAIRESLRRAFDWQSMGYAVAGSFGSAGEALSFFGGNAVDVLFCDIRLGGTTGLELAKKAKELQPGVKVVLISAYSEFGYAHDAIRLSVFDYLQKPVTYADVTECFERLRKAMGAGSGAGSGDAASAGSGAAPGDGSAGSASGGGAGDAGSASDGSASGASAGSAAGYHVRQIEMAKQYIDGHCGEDITLEGVANYVNLNPAYFSRYFKKHAGVRFVDYLCRLRVERAKALLADPANKVYEICRAVGYNSKHRFHKIFKQYTDLTPTEYRNGAK